MTGSLLIRYKKYLCHLRKEDFYNIYTYLIENKKEFEKGIFGWLIFQIKDGKQSFKEISKKQINFENKNVSRLLMTQPN